MGLPPACWPGWTGSCDRPTWSSSLAVDMPRLNAGTVARLTWAVEADPAVDGAVLVDGTGRRQTLAAVYRRSALDAARPANVEDEHGLPVRRLVGDLHLVDVPAVGRGGPRRGHLGVLARPPPMT